MTASYLEIVESRDPAQVGHQIAIPPIGNDMAIGRSSDCDVVIPATTVSRQHARLLRAAGVLTIRDLGSANGTSVNGTRINQPTPIVDQDVIGFGSLVVRYVIEADDSMDGGATTVVPPTFESSPTLESPHPASEFEPTGTGATSTPADSGHTIAVPPPAAKSPPTEPGTMAVAPPAAARTSANKPRKAAAKTLHDTTPTSSDSNPTTMELLGIALAAAAAVLALGSAGLWLLSS